MLQRILTKVTVQCAESAGFERKGSLFWRSEQDLVLLMELQSSQWGQGKYVNLGVNPVSMMTKPIPPGSGYWGLDLRASAVPSPFTEVFRQLEDDHDSTMDPKILLEPLSWLFSWLVDEWADNDRVRAAALHEDQWYSPYVNLVLKDWARGQLRDPRAYYGKTPYYG